MVSHQAEIAAQDHGAPDQEERHPAGGHPARRPTLVITPTRGWAALNLHEVWTYRDLLFILAVRDIKLRYKQTALGVLWVVLQPVVAAIIFAVLFGNFAKLPSNGLPYLLFVFCGLLPWTYFSSALQRAGNSLVASSQLISKVYFPRILIPMASTGAVVVDFLVSLVVMFLLLAVYQVGLTWQLLTLPFFFLLTTIAALGISFWLSALNVRYRDFGYAVPFLLQVWMYASPVVYAASMIPARWQWLFGLNPAVGFIEGFRWALLGQGAINGPLVILSTAVSLLAFFSGLYFFRRVERGFADIV